MWLFVPGISNHFYDGKIKGKNAWHENQDTPSQSPCMYFYLKNRIQTSNFARQMFQDWKNRFGGSTLSQFQAELRICESRIEKKSMNTWYTYWRNWPGTLILESRKIKMTWQRNIYAIFVTQNIWLLKPIMILHYAAMVVDMVN